MATWLRELTILGWPDLTRSDEPERVTLQPDPAKCVYIHPAGQTIRICSGLAWIACNGDDIFLAAGQHTQLPVKGDTAIVSGIGRDALIFEVQPDFPQFS